jgi:hypothetical protein
LSRGKVSLKNFNLLLSAHTTKDMIKKFMKRSNHILPQSVVPEDTEFVRGSRGRLAKQLKIVSEDLLAGISPEYLASIREAREDYRRGRVLSHEDVFKKIK